METVRKQHDGLAAEIVAMRGDFAVAPFLVQCVLRHSVFCGEHVFARVGPGHGVAELVGDVAHRCSGNHELNARELRNKRPERRSGFFRFLFWPTHSNPRLIR